MHTHTHIHTHRQLTKDRFDSARSGAASSERHAHEVCAHTSTHAHTRTHTHTHIHTCKHACTLSRYACITSL